MPISTSSSRSEPPPPRAGSSGEAAPRGASASGPSDAADRGAEIALKGVRRVFKGTGGAPDVTAVDGVDLTLAAGSFTAFVGPSGCGKSTLLRLIAGLDAPEAGEVLIAGTPAASRRVPAAYVFQDAHLLPWRTVRDNAALPLELLGIPIAERHAAAANALAEVGLTDAMNRVPSELSGGMKMRASLARALVTRPRLLLLDEPFAALDEITRNRLDDRLRALWSERRVTVVFVTHSVVEAAYLAERAIVFSPRPARVTLDRTLGLPAARAPGLRGTPEFAAEVRALQEALERGAA